MKNIILILIILFNGVKSYGQCQAILQPPQSQRLANYEIDLKLDHIAKKVNASQTITFKNHSPDTIFELRFYMYLNAFKNTYSTWIKGAEGNTLGQDITRRKKEDWGWVEVNELTDKSDNDLALNKKYIHPDDDNTDDESVLMVPLIEPILPGKTAVYKMIFESRLPRTIARSGWAENDFFLWVHWYPKLGVFERNEAGNWGWNCHQFMRQTEFYGEFGVYDVTLTYADHLVIGASGCLMESRNNQDGTYTRRYRAEDVIDFAWAAYPYFEVIKDKWKHVDITLLSPKEHRKLQPRFLKVLKHCFEYLEEHVGDYPYTTITIMDPPLLGMRNGFMEYPTFSTGGSFYGFPKGIRTIESLIVHEFTHQYFMGILANNEKEAPWLDEGFVTYFEDCIMEEYYGKKSSLFDILGFKIGNGEFSRAEYTGMDNHRESIVAQPGWKFKRYTKELVYSKTGTMLQTIRNIFGQQTMDAIMMTYFDKYKFTHPRANHFFNTATQVVSERHGAVQGEIVESIMHQVLYTTKVCDYAVKSVRTSNVYSKMGLLGKRGKDYSNYKVLGQKSTIFLERKGDFIAPVDVLITKEDGERITKQWSGEEYVKEFPINGAVESVHIDPKQKIQLDIDLNNNSFTHRKVKGPIAKYSWKTLNWLQNAFQALSVLM